MNEQESNEKRVASTSSPTTALSKQDTNVNAGFNALNLFNERELASAEIFLKKMIATDKGGIKNVNEGLAILMRAQDLQLPFSSCIEHIHVISGKTGVDIHIIRSLLSRAGVTWECTKDYTPQYQYTDGNTIYLETQLPQYCVKCRTVKEAEEKTDEAVVNAVKENVQPENAEAEIELKIAESENQIKEEIVDVAYAMASNIIGKEIEKGTYDMNVDDYLKKVDVDE